MKAYLFAGVELERKEIELRGIENNLSDETLEWFRADSKSRKGEKYRPKERKGGCLPVARGAVADDEFGL